MTKVLHFIHGLNTGGAETLVKNYMLNFGEEFEVALLCLRHENDSPYEEELAKNEVRVVYVQDKLPFPKQANTFEKAANHFFEYWLVRKIIREEAPDVLHTHLPINRLVKFARPRKGTVIFHTVHNEPVKLWQKDNKKRQKDLRAARWLVRHYGMKFIVLHREMLGEVRKMFGVSDVVVLNNGVDVERIKNARSGEKMRKELGIPKEAFALGHIGRFSKVKNQVFLVDIFAEVAKKNKNAFLIMVGDGPDEDKTVEKLEKMGLGGRYLVLSNRNDVPDLLSVMDIFVFPSLYEGLPLSLIEAQIARKLCFISDRVNEYADISNLVTRLSLDDSAQRWAGAILTYRKPAKVTVDESSWDIREVTKKLEQIYLDALAEKRDGKK